MQTMQQIEATFSRLRDEALDALAVHEREAHDGEACESNRCSAIAFFCHCFGVTPGQLMLMVLPLLEEYDRRCENHARCNGK